MELRKVVSQDQWLAARVAHPDRAPEPGSSSYLVLV